MPAARAAMQKGLPSRFVLFVFNAPANDLRLDATITDAEGRMHSFSPPFVARLQGDHVAKLVFDCIGIDGAARLDVVVHSSHFAADRRVGIPLEIR